MPSETLQFYGYAPVPVGHTVEITWFGQEEVRFFGKGEVKREDKEPMVRDLDTGIVYQTTWHATGEGSLMPMRLDYPMETPANLKVVERRIVRVVACRVLCAPNHDNTALVTILVVEPAPAGEGPYR